MTYSLKFLKKPLDVGDYIKNIVINNNYNELRLYDFITNHLLLFCLSTDCSSCLNTLEALHKFTEVNNKYNIVILLHASSDDFSIFFETFHSRVSAIISVEKSILTKKLNVRRMPRGYCLNKLGQVLAHNTGFEQYWIEKLVEPIQRVV